MFLWEAEGTGVKGTEKSSWEYAALLQIFREAMLYTTPGRLHKLKGEVEKKWQFMMIRKKIFVSVIRCGGLFCSVFFLEKTTLILLGHF